MASGLFWGTTRRLWLAIAALALPLSAASVKNCPFMPDDELPALEQLSQDLARLEKQCEPRDSPMAALFRRLLNQIRSQTMDWETTENWTKLQGKLATECTLPNSQERSQTALHVASLMASALVVEDEDPVRWAQAGSIWQKAFTDPNAEPAWLDPHLADPELACQWMDAARQNLECDQTEAIVRTASPQLPHPSQLSPIEAVLKAMDRVTNRINQTRPSAPLPLAAFRSLPVLFNMEVTDAFGDPSPIRMRDWFGKVADQLKEEGKTLEALLQAYDTYQSARASDNADRMIKNYSGLFSQFGSTRSIYDVLQTAVQVSRKAPSLLQKTQDWDWVNRLKAAWKQHLQETPQWRQTYSTALVQKGQEQASALLSGLETLKKKKVSLSLAEKEDFFEQNAEPLLNRCLGLATLYLFSENESQVNPRGKEQYEKLCAPFLCEDGAGIPSPEEASGFSELRQYQCHLYKDSAAIRERMKDLFLNREALCQNPSPNTLRQKALQWFPPFRGRPTH